MIREIVDKKIRSRKLKYSPQLRCFALTLQFYSSRAYDYVRKCFKNLLPHPATLRRWYTVVDGKPGFTDEAFQLIKQRSPVICNVVLDEMSIRSQVIYKQDRLMGYVDLRTEDKATDSCPLDML